MAELSLFRAANIANIYFMVGTKSAGPANATTRGPSTCPLSTRASTLTLVPLPEKLRQCKRFPIKRSTPKSKIINSRRRRRRVRNWRNRNDQYPERIFIPAHQREPRHFSPGPSANAHARRPRRRNLQRPKNMKQPPLPPHQHHPNNLPLALSISLLVPCSSCRHSIFLPWQQSRTDFSAWGYQTRTDDFAWTSDTAHNPSPKRPTKRSPSTCKQSKATHRRNSNYYSNWRSRQKSSCARTVVTMPRPPVRSSTTSPVLWQAGHKRQHSYSLAGQPQASTFLFPRQPVTSANILILSQPRHKVQQSCSLAS